MPEISEIVDSDDEYQDAVNTELVVNSAKSDLSSTGGESIKSNSEIVEEIREQTKVKTDDVVSGSKLKTNEEDTQVEYLYDEVDENELAEKEKLLNIEELQANKEKATQIKLEANALFKNNKHSEAIDMYTEALRICPLKATQERAVLFANRAAAKIKLGSKKTAIDDCNKAIELWPEYIRALLRRAKLYEVEDKLDEAMSDYKKVYELDPGQNEAREAMIRLPPIINERNERLKEEMLDKLKDLGNMVLKPFGLSTNNFQMQKDPNTGSYSINFNQNKS